MDTKKYPEGIDQTGQQAHPHSTKELSTIRAKFARLGFVVYELAGGGYLVAKDARQCRNVAALDGLLTTVEAWGGWQ